MRGRRSRNTSGARPSVMMAVQREVSAYDCTADCDSTRTAKRCIAGRFCTPPCAVYVLRGRLVRQRLRSCEFGLVNREAAHQQGDKIAAATLPPICRERLKKADVDGTSLSGTPPITATESGTKICESPMPLMISGKNQAVKLRLRRRHVREHPVRDREQHEADRRRRCADR